jgi:hypothetical protein
MTVNSPSNDSLPNETSDHSELLKKTPHVNTEFVAEVQQLSRQELERRVLIQKDWLGHYSRCLDGLGIKNIGVESCWNPRDIRRAFESLSKSPLEPKAPPSDVEHLTAALVQQEGVLNECEDLLKEALDENGVDVGFENRLEAYWESSAALADWRTRDLALSSAKETDCRHLTESERASFERAFRNSARVVHEGELAPSEKATALPIEAQCSWGCYYVGDQFIRYAACTVHGASGNGDAPR